VFDPGTPLCCFSKKNHDLRYSSTRFHRLLSPIQSGYWTSPAALSMFVLSSPLTLSIGIGYSLLVMEPSEFFQVWESVNNEKQRLVVRRDEIEMELHEIRNKLKHLDATLEHLTPLADMGDFVPDITQLGLTDAVRRILEESELPLAAADIRKQLNDRNYDLSGLSAPMASIYKVLSRLAEKHDEVKRQKDGNGRVYYEWIGASLWKGGP
jgi:hypothetical protein